DSWTKPEIWLALLQYAHRNRRVLHKAFALFSQLGGYPACHKGKEKRGELAELVRNTVVERTLMHDLNAGPGGRGRDPAVLKETFRRVCRYAGQAVAPSRIRQEVEQVTGPGVSAKRVTDAVRFLASALLIHEVLPVEGLTKK